MKDLFYWEAFEKNIGVLTKEEQEKLKDSKVAIVGLGGIGGIALELLARNGIQNFVISDQDKFEVSNLNRQILSTFKNLGKKKVKEAKKIINAINPDAKIEIFSKLNEKNVFEILKKVDVVVDGLDNALGRVIIARAAKKLKIPYSFGSADRSIGMSTIFLPRSDFERVMHLPSYKKMLNKSMKEKIYNCQKCNIVLGIIPNIVGTFEVLQSIKVLLNKDFVRSPFMFYINGMKKNPFSVIKLK